MRFNKGDVIQEFAEVYKCVLADDEHAAFAPVVSWDIKEPTKAKADTTDHTFMVHQVYESNFNPQILYRHE